MSVWTTKTLERDRKYIVLQHTLKGVNHSVNGIKFRDGYAVVEKDSKIYFFLKKIPVLKSAKEFPLSHLRKLPFITRTSDIKTVYGQDVYVKFLQEEQREKETQVQLAEQKREQELQIKLDLEKQLVEAKQANDETLAKEIQQNIPVITNCCYRTQNGDLCKDFAIEYSPSNYCAQHLLDDPKLTDFGFDIPKYMTKEERKKIRAKVKETLKSAKEQGKF